MGYGLTALMFLLGISLSFHFYAGMMLDESTTRLYGLDAAQMAAKAGNLQAPIDKLFSTGTSGTNLQSTTATYNAIMLIVLGGAATGVLASIIGSGGFATMYLIPAALMGGLIIYLTAPLDAMNAVLTGSMPADIAMMFYSFMLILYFVVVVSFIRGDF